MYRFFFSPLNQMEATKRRLQEYYLLARLRRCIYIYIYLQHTMISWLGQVLSAYCIFYQSVINPMSNIKVQDFVWGFVISGPVGISRGVCKLAQTLRCSMPSL